MERWIAKILVTIGVFLIPLLSTLLPFKVASCFKRHGEKGKTVLSCLMCFGGGVFFATYILHMAPEVRELLHTSLIEPNHITYPVADLIMAAGFFLVMFMEKIIVVVKKSKDKENKHDEERRGVECKSVAYDNPVVTTETCIGEKDVGKIEVAVITKPDSQETIIPSFEKQHGHNHEMDLLKDSHGGTRAIVLLVAISFHRAFEGLSIGLQSSTFSVWHLFAAVMCHEVIIGFSIGLEFVRYKWPLRRMIVVCFLCCIFMPVGTAVGALVSEMGDQDASHFDLLTGILQGIATGTFIYVTFFEILSDEIHSDTLAQPLGVLFGFVVMAALFTVPEGDEASHPVQLLKHNATFNGTNIV